MSRQEERLAFGTGRRRVGVAEGLDGARTSEHTWRERSCEPIATQHDHILLARSERERAVAEAIDRGGGTLTMCFRTSLCLARRQ